MNDPAELAPSARTWREIPQQVGSRAMSPQGRKRSVLSGAKTAGLVTLAVLLGWSGYEFATLDATPKKAASGASTSPVNAIVVKTDGVLDYDWVTRTLALPKNASLLDLNLHALQARLMEHGQVRTAGLTKVFPSTLGVTLAERSPVARVMAEVEQGRREFLVARDGTVFVGIGYDAEFRAMLPWLAVDKLVRQGRGFAPIDGMDVVADLLGKAKNEAPHLYQTWRIVDLTRLASDGELEVRSTDMDRIIFTTSLDFFVQIARLDHVRDTVGSLPKMRVNLGVGSQVVVAYDQSGSGEKPRTRSAADHPPAKSPLMFPDFSNPPRSSLSHRDL